MAVSRITTPAIDDEAITQAKIAASVDLGGAVKIANVQVANSSWSLLDDTAVDTDGGYVLVNGTNFVSGCNVLVGNTAATSVTFVSATQLRVQVPATAAGSYVMYVSNPDGSTGIRLNAITFSADPQWVTDSTLASQVVDSAISVQLSATDATSYSLQAGSSLPANTTLASNGLFSGTITGINEDTVYNFTVVATDAENQDSPRAFSVTVTVGDTYFKETVLLLNSEANTFIRDASNNSFNITPSGDVRPSAFSPYNTNWSNYFGGGSTTERRLTTTQTAIGTGNFTVAFWVYLAGTTGNDQQFFDTGTGGFVISVNTSTQLQLNNRAAGTATISSSAATAIPLNTWVHVAVVRSGTGASQVTMYVNGSSVGTGTMSSNFTSTTISIGGRYEVDAGTWYTTFGYISNVLYADSALSITVPTTSYTNQSGTKLLTCQSNRLIDNSTNAFTITKNGDVKISAFGPFTETDTTTGSAYFDGTGDYLTAPNSSGFDFGSGDFTIEAWVFPYSLAAAQDLFGFHAASPSTNADVGYTIYVGINNASNEAAVYSSTTKYAVTGWSITTYQWQHIAFVRTSGVLKLFINGVQVGSNVSASVAVNNNAAWPFYIGTYVAASRNFNGAISNLRVVKGTAVYTSAFTPPAAPLEAIANTQLLTLQNRIGYNNHQFVDSAGVAHIITRNGNASQGSFSPYVPTGWSGYFDGTGDFLSLTGTSATNFNGVNWTFECWFYKTALSGGNDSIIQSTTGTNNWIPYFGLGLNNNLTITASLNAVAYTSSQTYSLDSWNHIAMVRSGGVVKVYLNGTATSISVTSDITSTNLSFWFGKTDNSPGGGNYLYYFYGYLSNLRLVKGTAVYTSNFTPPTSPLKPISNTQLLMLRSRSFVDESANRFAITRSGDVRVVPFSPFKSHTITANSHSVYFDGTGAGDYFSVASSNALAFGTGDFAIEGWYYPLAYTSNTSSIMSTTSLDSSTNNAININVTANGSMILGGAHATANNLVPLNTWTHFVVSRVSSTIKIFLDGVERVSAANSSNFISTGCLIGARLAAGTYYPTAQAYISNIKVVTGFGVTSVTVPTTPLTANSSTVLLTCQSNTIIDNSNNAFSFTAAGTRGPLASKFNPFGETITQVVEYSPNTHGGSVYLDGNDYLEYSNNTTINDMRVGTSNWTVEGWIYPTSTAATQYFYWHYGTTTDVLALRYNGSTGAVIGSLRATNLTEQTLTSSVTHTINQWIHVAMARANTTTVRLFTNGILSNTLTISATASINDTALQNFTLGCSTNPVTNYFTGYMSDWRYTKGRCLYTTSFIPPLQSHQSIQGTHVLQKFTAGTIVDRSGRDVNETVGNASTSSAVKKFGTGSLYFDGTGDYLIMPRADPNVAFGTGNFTIEFWLYFLVTPSLFYALFDTRPASTQGVYTFLYLNNDRTLRFWVSSADRITSSVLSANTWYHVAVCRSSSSTKMFIDGTQTGSTYNDTNNYIASRLIIGSSFSGGSSITNSLNGYLDDLRITRFARYTSNFTAPSALQTK